MAGTNKKKKGQNNMQTQLEMKGSVVGVVTLGDAVEVWVLSPTGDSSDSFQYIIPCRTEAQAEVIAEMWRKVWGL